MSDDFFEISDPSEGTEHLGNEIGAGMVTAFDADPTGYDDPDFDGPPKPETGESEEVAPEQQEAAEEQAEQVEASEDNKEAADEVKKAVAEAIAKPKARQLTLHGEDGKALALTETTTLEHRIDGKVTKVPLKDLVENFAGKVAWDRKMQEVAGQRKEVGEKAVELGQREERHRGLINDMHKNVMEGKTYAAVQNLIDMTGAKLDARQYINELRAQILAQAKEMEKMSPEQRAFYEQQEEFDYKRARHDRDVQRLNQEQAQRAFQDRVAKAIETSGASTEEYVQTLEYMRQAYPKLGRDPKTITPEDVAAQINDKRDWETVKEAMDAVDPELVKDEKLWQSMVVQKQLHNWTLEELRDIFQRATSEKRSKTLSRKVAKAPTATPATSAIKAKKAPKQASDPNDWDNVTDADMRW